MAKTKGIDPEDLLGLSGLLERIIFDEADFDKIKGCIRRTLKGEADPEELKKTIIASYIRILQELTKVFPFYYEQMNTRYDIDDFANNKPNATLNTTEIELLEKDFLLEEVGKRVQAIFLKLQSKEEG